MYVLKLAEWIYDVACFLDNVVCVCLFRNPLLLFLYVCCSEFLQIAGCQLCSHVDSTAVLDSQSSTLVLNETFEKKDLGTWMNCYETWNKYSWFPETFGNPHTSIGQNYLIY